MSLECPIGVDQCIWDCLPRDIQGEIITQGTAVTRNYDNEQPDCASTSKSRRCIKRKIDSGAVTQSTITNWATQKPVSISIESEVFRASPSNPGNDNSAQFIPQELKKTGDTAVLKEQQLVDFTAEVNGKEAADVFTDTAFPASAESIDGRPLSSNSHNLTKKRSVTDIAIPEKQSDEATNQNSNQLTCKCNVPIKVRQVSKDGPNQGRFFASCSLRSCNHFAWADNSPHSESTSKIIWKRFNQSDRWTLLGPKGIYGVSPNDILQGGVGDCWFLSALAVIAGRRDLMQKIIKSTELNDNGKIVFSLFIDGIWREIIVDNYLPCQKPSIIKYTKKNFINSSYIIDREGSTLVYSKISRAQLWVPLLEKAYAKAHGNSHLFSLSFVFLNFCFSCSSLFPLQGTY